MKDNFVAAAIKAMDEVLSRSIITGYKFHFIQCLWRQPQKVRIQGIKNPTDRQNASCFGIPTYQYSRRKYAFEHEDIARNQKLTLFLDYCNGWRTGS